jgi:hypothetical protein
VTVVLHDNFIDLHAAADALQTALSMEDHRLVGVMTRSMRMALADGALSRDRRATQSLLLRQVERAAQAGAYGEAAPILTAFKSTVG